MLSNLASYLLGYAEPSVPTTIEDEIRLTAVETEDDDWIMIEKSDEKEETEEDRPVSRSSSATSLPCLSLEESWFITPPPCFTSTGSVTVETSPMENLLIEHPSMSVYHHHRGLGPHPRSHLPAPAPATEAAPPAPAPPPRNRNSTLYAAPNTNTAHTPRHRHSHAELYYGQPNLTVQIAAARKLQIVKTSKWLKRNQLERENKAREVNNQKKRHCRKDRQKNHSGANNNRKCC